VRPRPALQRVPEQAQVERRENHSQNSKQTSLVFCFVLYENHTLCTFLFFLSCLEVAIYETCKTTKVMGCGFYYLCGTVYQSLVDCSETLQMPLKATADSGVTEWCLLRCRGKMLSLKVLPFISSASGFAEMTLRRSPRIKQLSFSRTNSGSFYSVSQPKSRSVQRIHSSQQESGKEAWVSSMALLTWNILGKRSIQFDISPLAVNNQGDTR
jgi:hypothetical protein